MRLLGKTREKWLAQLLALLLIEDQADALTVLKALESLVSPAGLDAFL